MKDKDLLKEFITPEMSGKAPEGFTNRVMTRVMLEKEVNRKGFLLNRFRVPIVVGLISAVLITSTAIFSSPSENPWLNTASDTMQKITFKMPPLSDSILTSENIPVIIIYITIALFLLSLFDRGLKNLFHRKT
jgi:hypothetical protein